MDGSLGVQSRAVRGNVIIEIAQSATAFAPPRTPKPAAAGTGARRVIFIDLARALAVVLMVQGHTLDVLLDRSYLSDAAITAWTFQRGLTSCLFLILSGFAFSVVTRRRWASHTRLSWPAITRLRRFTLFVLLGYALHFPAPRLAQLRAVDDEQWRAFLAVDVLQAIGVSLIVLQLLVLVLRTPRRFTIGMFAGCIGLIAVTPWAWGGDWPQRLWPGLFAYLSPATGSLFPLVPWTGFVMLGAGLGQVYSHWGAERLRAFANRFLLAAGGATIALAAASGLLHLEPFGPSAPWSSSPNQFALRAGVVMVVLGGLVYVSERLGRLPHIVTAIAQESLFIYFVHLCIVYGSIWNRGLRAHYGHTLPPLQALLVALALAGAMAMLAWFWNWCKHAHQRPARVAAAAAFAYLAWVLV